jgi:ferredoxin-nitrite reductase
MSSELNACPGLFYATPAQDGILSRLRIPGGILNARQCEAIATLADQFGGGYVNVTNRANLQIREVQTIAPETLAQLQKIGLASPIAEVDAIRNIMSSPTAGIDRQELIDMRPFVTRWNQYLIAHPELSILSAKFSVCFDGGGAVSVRDRPNDITFSAIKDKFRLALSVGERGESPRDIGVWLKPDECLPTLAALTEVYRDRSLKLSQARRKPRLREVLNCELSSGVESYLRDVEQRLSFSLRRYEVQQSKPLATNYEHLGVHSQQQQGLFYVGLVLPLGRLETFQLRGLAALSAQYACGELRLTPWQNVLIPNVPEQLLTSVQQRIQELGLHWSDTRILGGIVACSGITGCASSATNTQQDAIALAHDLEQQITLDRPINLHFSGCEKSCAQHTQSDITLLGVDNTENNTTGYDIYIANVDTEGNTKFGSKIYQSLPSSVISIYIEKMLKVYQLKRENASESFKKFTARHTISQLKQLFNSL